MKKVPMRMCVGCREMKEKRELKALEPREHRIVAHRVAGREHGIGAVVPRRYVRAYELRLVP